MRGAKLESSPRGAVERLRHLAEDVHPALARLGERVAEDLERHARDLDVHLQGGDALLGAGDLEVHVAEVVLDAGDVGEDGVVVALLDEAHGHARDRPLERHARVHQRQRGAAHRGHRRRAVGLEDVRHDADRVGELLLRRDHRDQRALGERAVADVAALRAAHEAGLAHRERREVVVVEVALGRLEPEVVQPHLLAGRAEGDDGEGLRLAAREQRGAVRAREQPDLGRDRPDLGLRAAVRALLVDGDPLADHVLLELVERELRARAVLGVRLGGGVAGVVLEHVRLDRLRRVLAGELVLHARRLVELRAVRLLDLRVEVLVDLRGRDLELLLRRLGRELVLRRAELLDRVVRDVERVEHLRFGDLVRARLDHQDGLVGARDHEVEVGGELLLLRRVDDEVALHLADPHGAHGRRERDVGDHERRGGAVHREDVPRRVVIDRQRDRHELRLVAPALGEQRPERAVDHAGDQRRLLPRAALALEERAGDLAGRVHPLLDVHRERHEVDVAQVARRSGPQHARVACGDEDGTGGLLGHLAGLEVDLRPADLDGNPLHFCHVFLSRPAARSVAGPFFSKSLRK